MKKVALIVPAYNEEKRIAAAASALFSSNFLKENCKFIFIVDGADGTGEILEQMEKNGARVSIEKYGKRLGKGGAVAEGIRLAETEYAGFVDVDSRMPIARIEKLVRMLLEGGLDCIIGKRERVEGAPFFRRISSKAFNLLVNLLFGLGISDTQCGCKFFKRKLVFPKGKNREIFRVKGFAFDVELLGRIRKSGGKITEFGFSEKWGEQGGFSLFESPKMFLDLIRIRFL